MVKKQIQKQFTIARIQATRLLSLEHEALQAGLPYVIERDEQFTRVIWVFWYNIGKRTSPKAVKLPPTPQIQLFESEYVCPLGIPR